MYWAVATVPAFVLLVASCGAGCNSEELRGSAARSDVLLEQGWRFHAGDVPGAEGPAFDDAQPGWTNVTVPHTYNALDGQDGGGDYYRGPAWYRVHVEQPAERAGRRTYLELEGASAVADVYVNGLHQGQHRGAFSRFRFDVTEALAAGDNVIAVKVDNAPRADTPPLTGDFTMFGGLYRDVHVLTVPDLHIDLPDDGGPGVALRTSDVSAEAATLEARLNVVNTHAESSDVRVTLTLLDAAGSAVERATRDVSVAGFGGMELALDVSVEAPRLWRGRRDPYLYTAVVELSRGGRVLDVVSQPVGFRTVALDPNLGFFLNGEPLDLRGVSRHQDRVDKGWAIGKREHDEDMALILELGATAVRLAHYQHSQYFYELCDRAGIVVWAEIPLIDSITDSPEFRDNARQQLTELIRQSHNHPSIAFWGIGNEQRTDDAATNGLLAELAALAKSEDPSRLTTYAHCCGNATGALVSHADATGHNLYFGWYSDTPAQLGPFLDAVHAARPTAAIAVSEYGAGASLSQHEDPPRPPAPAGPFHPEEYQSQFHEAHWRELAARPYVWGKFVWNMFDFASDERNEGDTPGRNDKGLVSYDRATKKDAFFWYKASWSSEPVVHITSRRFEPRMTELVDVKVYSNAERVTLRVNGAELDALSAPDHLFRWPSVRLVPGPNTVEAVARDAAGAELGTDSVVWTLEASAP